MFKSYFNIVISFILLVGFQAVADSLADRTIRSGPRAGQKLITIIDKYTVPGESGGAPVHIPALAVEQTFNFFDRYANTTRTYTHKGLRPADGRPGFESLAGVVTTTGPTIANQDLIVIFDMNQRSSVKRLHVINIQNGEIKSFEAAHGAESECSGRPGFACRFVSDRDSSASPLGFFIAEDIYNSVKHGDAITLVGLEKSSNRFSGNDVPSTIVIHSADYVYAGHAGRSNGCPAVSEANIGWIRENVVGGALFYFYHSQLDFDGRDPLVSGLQSTVSAPPANTSVEVETPAADDDEQ